MDPPRPDQKKLVGKLLKGKESATQLQTLLQTPFEYHGSVSAVELAVQIVRSFTDTLAMLGPNEICQILAAEGVSRDCSIDRSSKATDAKRKRPGVKDRRGCYRRRNVSETRMKVSSTMEDEYAWRKYGQKEILNSRFPRCYFRCTHKNDQGCKAIKQVQMIKQDPTTYQTTYFGHHTCKDTLRAPQIIHESDPMDSCLLSFETKMPSKQDCLSSAIIPSPKEAIIKEDTNSTVSDNNSLLESALWQDLVTSGSSGPAKVMPSKSGSAHGDKAVSGVYSCSSNTLRGLDMEAFIKFADLDNNLYFDESEFFEAID